MQIKGNYDITIDVFAVYWDDNKTVFCGLLPKKSYGGLIAYNADDIAIEEPSISFRTVFYQNNSMRGVFHWALIERGLLDNLYEADVTAYNSFLSIIKSEHLVKEDFY